MRTPTVYTVTQLGNWDSSVEIHAGVWVPARPIGLQGLSLITRCKIAWKVFLGKYDAVEWYKQ